MRKITPLLVLSVIAIARAEVPIDYTVEAVGNAGTEKLAPYQIASNSYGTITQGKTLQLRAALKHEWDTTSRFSWGFGAEVIAEISNRAPYLHSTPSGEMSADGQPVMTLSDTWQRPAAFWLHQLYGEVRYRSIFASLGSKERGSAWLNDRLSSGDVTEGPNARPIPQLRLGFSHFVPVPFTNRWFQVDIVYSLGRTTDDRWLENHQNHFNGIMTKGVWYSYKRVYLGSNPDKPLFGFLGVQMGTQIAGTTVKYRDGVAYETVEDPFTFKSFLHTLIPSNGTRKGNERYYDGNGVGSCDFYLRYRFSDGRKVKLYLQRPFEDASGMGFLNGFDGVYGIEYSAGRKAAVSGAVLEYLDFTNQSGPVHWAPGDHTNLPAELTPGQATGNDDYYNNFQYNGYAHYGMSIGTPMLQSTLYDHSGTLRYYHNRIRGFHIGVEGNITPAIDYRVLLSHRTSWGTYSIPDLSKPTCFSMMVEAGYEAPFLSGLHFTAQLAIDRGRLYGNNFGALVSARYSGNFSLGK